MDDHPTFASNKLSCFIAETEIFEIRNALVYLCLKRVRFRMTYPVHFARHTVLFNWETHTLTASRRILIHYRVFLFVYFFSSEKVSNEIYDKLSRRKKGQVQSKRTTEDNQYICWIYWKFNDVGFEKYMKNIFCEQNRSSILQVFLKKKNNLIVKYIT